MTTRITGTGAIRQEKIYNASQLLEARFFDHKLNNEEWLLADTFSWQDGNVYSDAYNHLVNDISENILKSDYIASNVIKNGNYKDNKGII